MALISKQCEYAVLAVWELAYSYGNRQPVSVQKIAAKYSFSASFLTQIFQVLREANLVETIRGPQGGYRLIPPPDSLTLGYIFCLFDKTYSSKRKNTQKKFNNQPLTLIKNKEAPDLNKEKLEKICQKAEAYKQEYLNNILYSDLIKNPDDNVMLDFSI